MLGDLWPLSQSCSCYLWLIGMYIESCFMYLSPTFLSLLLVVDTNTHSYRCLQINSLIVRKAMKNRKVMYQGQGRSWSNHCPPQSFQLNVWSRSDHWPQSFQLNVWSCSDHCPQSFQLNVWSCSDHCPQSFQLNVWSWSHHFPLSFPLNVPVCNCRLL